MRVADYVMKRLEEERVKQIFMLSGGGIMYLVDALGRSNIEYICCHHEQAAAIAAESYAIAGDGLGVCLVTTGPGGTNALTAAGASFVDSTPVLFLSGQVKTADFASLRHVRQFGAQENDIVSMAKPVTKYAVTVMKAEDIVYELDKAIYISTHGRKGPVWVDIPLDVQNTEIDPETLRKFDEAEIKDTDIVIQRGKNSSDTDSVIGKLIKDLHGVKRPLIIAGNGLKASGSYEAFYRFREKIGCPVLCTWRTLDLMDFDDPYFFGSPGLQACRYSNLITQGCDLLIVLGSRLDNMITAFSEEHFAFRAKKYIVDIDINEIEKLAMTDVTAVNMDIKAFIDSFEKCAENETFPAYDEWLAFCRNMKERFPLLEEKQEQQTDMVDLYRLTMTLSEYCKESDVIVPSSTSRCNTAGHMAFKHKKGQRIVSCMGFGSMGYALPCTVGAYYAADKGRVIMIEGDGSLQLNIQELQTVVHNKINAKMFIFHNAGYAAISTMQNRNFDGFHVGCDEESGVTMPDLSKVSAAYGIPYYRIVKNEEIDETVKKVMESDGPVICEFIGSITFDEIPKCISSLDSNGKRVSAALENPFPFLSEEEMNEIYKGF
ncbi:MAG: Acetolactate synthase isozyme 2 large subunit [Firmicutes bacterium ADurb.Bin354]|nr:MAG: Acetolactate synthase isozyme 2 large subunit [Firmicutes bacterium ADurb.Bin354]